jgi:hypothetical protein
MQPDGGVNAWSVSDMYKNLAGLNGEVNLNNDKANQANKQSRHKKNQRRMPLPHLFLQLDQSIRFMDDIENDINKET